MSGLENLQTRLQFKGGNAQLDRMKSSSCNRNSFRWKRI